MTVWKELDGWTYEYFERSIAPAELHGFEDIAILWNEKRRGREMPSWEDFDFYDFKGWHGKINLATIEFDPFNYTYKLFGTKSTDLLGGEWTGKTGHEIIEALNFPAEDTAFYEMTCKNAYISRMSGVLPYQGAQSQPVVFVEFPLSDNDETVTHTLEFTL